MTFKLKAGIINISEWVELLDLIHHLIAFGGRCFYCIIGIFIYRISSITYCFWFHWFYIILFTKGFLSQYFRDIFFRYLLSIRSRLIDYRCGISLISRRIPATWCRYCIIVVILFHEYIDEWASIILTWVIVNGKSTTRYITLSPVWIIRWTYRCRYVISSNHFSPLITVYYGLVNNIRYLSSSLCLCYWSNDLYRFIGSFIARCRRYRLSILFSQITHTTNTNHFTYHRYFTLAFIAKACFHVGYTLHHFVLIDIHDKGFRDWLTISVNT